jgi:hypothetical protein
MAKKIIRPIRNEAEYDDALEEVERYFETEPKEGTAEADRFDLLALIVEDYERRRWPIEPLPDGNRRLYPGRPRPPAGLAAACLRHPDQEATADDENGLETAPRVEYSGRGADRTAADAWTTVGGMTI